MDPMLLGETISSTESGTVHYGFWMPDEDLVADNIRTARAFASYICRRSA